MTRIEYMHQLQSLREAVVAMASMVDKAVARSVEALRTQDVVAARDIIIKDQEINAHRWEVEERALLVIATQAPMASDLRTIAAVIHIITDLERMADHAAGIAKIVIETAHEPLLKQLVDLIRMSDVAREMLNASITAFIQADAGTAATVAGRDDEVDHLYERVYHDLLGYMLNDPATITRATHLLWAAHNLERIADRVTNICEQVVFAVTGEMSEIGVSTY